jgi:hypothetical protein
MKDGRGIFFSGERYIREAIEATRGSWVVLYVQYAVRCDVVTVEEFIINPWNTR